MGPLPPADSTPPPAGWDDQVWKNPNGDKRRDFEQVERRIREEKKTRRKKKKALVPPPRLLLFHSGAARGKLSVRQVPVCALPLPCRGPVSYLEQAEQKVGYAQQRLRSSCKQGRGTASSRLLQHRAAAWSGGLRAKKVEREGRQHPGRGWAQGGCLQLRTPQGTRSTEGSESCKVQEFKRDVQVGVSSESKATRG